MLDTCERNPELVLIARAEVESPVLHAEAATIRVVSHLALRELQHTQAIVVKRAEPVVEAAPVLSAVGHLSAQLIGTRSLQQRIALQQVVAQRDEQLLDALRSTLMPLSMIPCWTGS